MRMFFIILILLSFYAEAADQPMLRLNTQMHTAHISRMSIDAQQRFLVTGSHDKTARVWDLKTGELLKVLRPPIGEGNEGKIWAVAISPDGETIAIGGLTGKVNETKSIYFFNRIGQLNSKISGLQNIILHLIYSPNGQFLVACLGGGEGIKIYQNNQLHKEDKDYGADSYWADFDAQGRLVTSSYDGKVRLYDINFNLIQQVNTTIGKEPYTVRFSPDGNKIAVGFHDLVAVQVLSSDNLKLLYHVDTKGISNMNLNLWHGRRMVKPYSQGGWRKIMQKYFFDQNGKQLWEKPTPAIAWAVNIPENGKTVVAALGDGTIRWYRLSDGVELSRITTANAGCYGHRAVITPRPPVQKTSSAGTSITDNTAPPISSRSVNSATTSIAPTLSI